MRKIIAFFTVLSALQATAQDSTMNSLTKEMDKPKGDPKKIVKIFNSERLINANTTELVGKGKMNFKVAHNFGDIGGHDGGIDNFFGLDASTDIRIGFDIGLTDRLDISLSRNKGDETLLKRDTIPAPGLAPPSEFVVRKLYQVGLKYQLLRQLENDPSHPVSLALFVNTAISTTKQDKVHPDLPNSFKNFGERMSQVFQLIVAKKMGKVSVELTPTLVHYNFTTSYDDPTTFSLGGAARIPISNSFAFIIDYFHTFHSDQKKANYYNRFDAKFHDPLGIGMEITTAGHVFHMNFTNCTAILENQFIPYNTNSWGKGQFRWGFNISRTFILWRDKRK